MDNEVGGEDEDVSRLKEKSKKGIANMLESALEDESVKKMITRVIVKQSLESGLFLSLIIVGSMMVVNAVKVAVGLTWEADVTVGSCLIAVGTAYMSRKIKG